MILAANGNCPKFFGEVTWGNARMGIGTLAPAATKLITHSSAGNLRLYRNLCYCSLIEAARETQKIA